jgi:hypothetical protein
MWDLQDVENWYETEGSISRKGRRVNFAQKEREPLEKIARALRTMPGIKRCPTYPASVGGYQTELPLVESATFVKHFKGRVKTRKARSDLEELERLILERPKEMHEARRRAQEILLSS